MKRLLVIIFLQLNSITFLNKEKTNEYIHIFDWQSLEFYFNEQYKEHLCLL